MPSCCRPACEAPGAAGAAGEGAAQGTTGGAGTPGSGNGHGREGREGEIGDGKKGISPPFHTPLWQQQETREIGGQGEARSAHRCQRSAVVKGTGRRCTVPQETSTAFGWILLLATLHASPPRPTNSSLSPFVYKKIEQEGEPVLTWTRAMSICSSGSEARISARSGR